MKNKDTLIIEILEKDLKGVRKVLKDQEAQIKDISKNGFDPEIHPGWHLDIRTGLSYTQGYCIGYIAHAEKMVGLLKLKDANAVLSLIEENKKIEAANKKHLDEVFGDIKKRLKATEKNEDKKTLNDVFGINKKKKVR